MPRTLHLLLALACAPPLSAQVPALDTANFVYVHILHGSVPRREYKKEESKMLGRKYGGHVVTQIGEYAYGYNFNSSRVHPFARKKKSCMAGLMEKQDAQRVIQSWYDGDKVTTIAFPATPGQKNKMRLFAEDCHSEPRFDYAFFGMRCASTCYHLLGKGGLIKPSTRFRSIRKAFHPKQLRKKLVRHAKRKGYKIVVNPGSARRKWEGD